MGKKVTTEQATKFDPGSMSAFQAATGTWLPGMQQYAQDPFTQTYFLLRQAMAQKQIGAMGQAGMSNILQNALTGGFAGAGGGALSPFLQSQILRQGRATSGLQSNAFMQNLFGAEQARQWALGNLAGYRPLQTGQTTVQRTSGLGTWLPQALGMGLSLAAAPFTGGASLMGLGGALGSLGRGQTGMGPGTAIGGMSGVPLGGGGGSLMNPFFMPGGPGGTPTFGGGGSPWGPNPYTQGPW